MQNLKEKWLVVSQMTWGIWWISPEHSKSLKFGFWKTFMFRVYNVELKTTEELCVMTLKCDTIFKEQLAGNRKNDLKNLINFRGSSGKSENLHLDGFLLFVACKVSAKKVQKSYLSWYWRVIQTLKKKWPFVWRMTWGNWWILTRAF